MNRGKSQWKKYLAKKLSPLPNRSSSASVSSERKNFFLALCCLIVIVSRLTRDRVLLNFSTNRDYISIRKIQKIEGES